MNLRWNPGFRRFEAEFSDFQSDLETVKAAGFKTDGPPEWIWYSYKAEPLTKLKGRPGLTITPEAKAQYAPLAAVEANNAKVKAELALHKKELKKTLKENEGKTALVIPPKGYISACDLPPMPPPDRPFARPAPPDTKCIICQQPVYEYEYAAGAPLICLWDQKIVLDNSADVC